MQVSASVEDVGQYTFKYLEVSFNYKKNLGFILHQNCQMASGTNSYSRPFSISALRKFGKTNWEIIVISLFVPFTFLITWPFLSNHWLHLHCEDTSWSHFYDPAHSEEKNSVHCHVKIYCRLLRVRIYSNLCQCGMCP